MNKALGYIQSHAGKTEELSHPFYKRVKDIVDNEDYDTLLKEKIYLKLLRLDPQTQEGFVLSDFPSSLKEVEMLEEFRGGVNACVHLSLPDHVLLEIEQNKYVCKDCSRQYYKQVRETEHGVFIEEFLPKDGICYDCGSTNIEESGDPIKFE